MGFFHHLSPIKGFFEGIKPRGELPIVDVEIGEETARGFLTNPFRHRGVGPVFLLAAISHVFSVCARSEVFYPVIIPVTVPVVYVLGPHPMMQKIDKPVCEDGPRPFSCEDHYLTVGHSPTSVFPDRGHPVKSPVAVFNSFPNLSFDFGGDWFRFHGGRQ